MMVGRINSIRFRLETFYCWSGKGADNRNIPSRRHFIRGIGDAFVQRSTDHHRFAAAHQHRIIHRAGVEGGLNQRAGAGGGVRRRSTSCSISSSTESPSLICGLTLGA